ncbi:MAG: GNAT family N-acetyltransferase [Paracoccaceae bacterium]
MLHGTISPDLQSSRVTSLAALEAMAGPLEDLALSSGALVYQHPAFFLPWARVAAQAGQSPACLAIHRGERLVGFLPLFLRRDRRALMARTLVTPRYGSSPPFDLMVAPQDQAAVMDLMVEEVSRLPWLEQRFRFDVQGTTLGGAWADRFADLGFQVSRQPGPDYFLHQCQGGADGFRDSLPRKHRMNCERLERRLLSEGHVALVTGPGNALDRALQDMGAIVRRSWKGTAEMDRRGLAMLVDVARSLAAAGMLRLWLAHVSDRPVAYLLEIEDWRRHRHAFHNAQDEEMGHYGPGAVLLFTSLRAAYGDGQASYDYWGYRPYLHRFSNQLLPTRNVVIGRPGALPALQRGAMRLFSKGAGR